MRCQVCGGDMRPALQKEANVSCGDYFAGRRLYPDNLGPFTLHACAACGFAAFAEFDGWRPDDFRERIYNAQYHLCDEPFEEARPRALSDWLAPLVAGRTLLDFGGGRGVFAAMIRAKGVAASSYDPFYGDATWPEARAEIVTAFEVVEHVPDQAALFAALTSLLAPRGVLVFSTLLRPSALGPDWWYASPRNGHVCFHSRDSLVAVGRAHGLTVHSLSREMHCAARDPADLADPAGWPTPRVNEVVRHAFVDGWDTLAPVPA